MTQSTQWYIYKLKSGNCEIVNHNPADDPCNLESNLSSETWGPYSSQNEAIAKRVGLIRAGKCLPR